MNANRTQRLKLIIAAILTITLVGMGLNLVFPLLSIRLANAGYSNLYVGVATAISGIANILIAPLIPGWARRFGVRRVILVALALSTLSICLFDFAPNEASDLALRFIFGAAIGALFLMSEYWINAAAPEARRGLVLGIYGSFLALGFAAGPLILELVGTAGPEPFYWGALIFVGAAVPVAVLAGGAPDMEEGSHASVLTFFIAVPIATLAGFLFGILEPSAFNLFPVYGLGIGLPLSHATALISAMALGNILQIPIGILSDRLDRRVMLLICGILGTMGAAVLPLLSAYPNGLFIGLIIWSGIASGLYTVGLTLLGARYRGADLAHANAAFIILYNAGMIVGPPLIGATMDAMPPQGFFVGMGGIFLIYSVVAGIRLSLNKPG